MNLGGPKLLHPVEKRPKGGTRNERVSFNKPLALTPWLCGSRRTDRSGARAHQEIVLRMRPGCLWRSTRSLLSSVPSMRAPLSISSV